MLGRISFGCSSDCRADRSSGTRDVLRGHGSVRQGHSLGLALLALVLHHHPVVRCHHVQVHVRRPRLASGEEALAVLC